MSPDDRAPTYSSSTQTEKSKQGNAYLSLNRQPAQYYMLHSALLRDLHVANLATSVTLYSINTHTKSASA